MRVALPGGMRVLATQVGTMAVGAQVVLAIRPEAIRMGEDSGQNRAEAVVRSWIYLGDHQRLLAGIDNGVGITVKVAPGIGAATGATVVLSWAAADCLAFPAAGLADDILNKDWASP